MTLAGYLWTNLFANLKDQKIQKKNSGHHEDSNTTKSLDNEVKKVRFDILNCLREYVYHSICVKLLPKIAISQFDIS